MSCGVCKGIRGRVYQHTKPCLALLSIAESWEALAMIPLNYNALFNILLTLSFQIMILYNDVKKKVFGKF